MTEITFESLKQEGNKNFESKNYQKAQSFYSKALEMFPGTDKTEQAKCLSNRSLCSMQLENYGSALADADQCIQIDQNFVKGYYRKSSALIALGKPKDAKNTLLFVQNTLKISNKDIQDKLKQLTVYIREYEFFQCIEQEDEIDKLKYEDLVTDKNYKGPVLVYEQVITLEWIQELLSFLRKDGKLDKKSLWILIKRAKEIMDQEKNVEYIQTNENKRVIVCGDVHGQFFDLLNIFKLFGYPSEQQSYLFNGDFVDRGSYSVEVMITLYAFKLVNPKCIYLNRGNHESHELNQMYGFTGEVLAKYCQGTLKLFQDSFKRLPIAHIIDSKYFVVHGGLSMQRDMTIEDIQKINRKQEVPKQGMFNDLLWSDPQPGQGYLPNPRGCSVQFGLDVVDDFLKNNKLEMIVRSHQVMDEGFQFVDNSQKVVTLFSAPNYCDIQNNKAAVMIVEHNKSPIFEQFLQEELPKVPCMYYARQAMNLMKQQKSLFSYFYF